MEKSAIDQKIFRYLLKGVTYYQTEMEKMPDYGELADFVRYSNRNNVPISNFDVKVSNGIKILEREGIFGATPQRTYFLNEEAQAAEIQKPNKKPPMKRKAQKAPKPRTKGERRLKRLNTQNKSKASVGTTRNGKRFHAIEEPGSSTSGKGAAKMRNTRAKKIPEGMFLAERPGRFEVEAMEIDPNEAQFVVYRETQTPMFEESDDESYESAVAKQDNEVQVAQEQEPDTSENVAETKNTEQELGADDDDKNMESESNQKESENDGQASKSLEKLKAENN